MRLLGQINNWIHEFILSKKMIVCIMTYVFMMEDVVVPLVKLADETSTQYGICEPFILLLSYYEHFMVVPVLFIVVMADFPAKENDCIFAITRMGKTKYVVSQIIYAFVMSLFLILVLGIMSILYSHGENILEWSEYMTVFHLKFPELYQANNQLFVESSTANQGTVLRVLVNSILLLAMFLTVLAEILCYFKLKGRRFVGITVSLGLLIMGIILHGLNLKARWIFPVSHVIYGAHFDAFLRKPICELWISYAYFIVLIAIMSVVNIVTIKNSQIGDERL